MATQEGLWAAIESSKRAMAELRPIDRLAALHELFEENYRKLRQLIPALPYLPAGTLLLSVATPPARGTVRARPPRTEATPLLQIEILERSRYTALLEFNYRFSRSPVLEPALKARVYFDAEMVEVLRDRERKPPRYPSRAPERSTLKSKWRLNYFLFKWLDHCLKRGYLLEPVDLREVET